MSKRVWRLLGGALLLAVAAAGVQAKADPNKVLRVAFEAADDGFDLVRSNNNLYSSWVGYGIFDTLLTYDYLARPAKIVPLAAEAMPEVTPDGKTITFRLKQGIFFHDDPAFKGKKRELVAADVAYTIKRILDPKNRSHQAAAFEGKIVGMDKFVERARKGAAFDYDTPVPGLEVVDRYTFRMHLTRMDQNMLHLLTHATTGLTAREVIDYYGADTGRHPVGTGPYILKQYVPRSKVILEANPDYRGFVWDFKSSGEPWDEQVIRDMKGKQMPQIGRVEVNIIEEEQSRWLAFANGELDFDKLAENAAPKVLNADGSLKPEYAAKGIRNYRFVNPDLVYTIVSMKDPVVGGYTPEKLALRRAIAMAYDINADIEKVRFGQAVRAQSNVPPGVAGHDPGYRKSWTYDPNLANKLLDRFGYKRGADGYRTLPDGKPLSVRFHPAPSSRDQTISEIWKRSLDRIGIRSEFKVGSFADNLKAASNCELQFWWLGMTASIPDGQDFMESLYGGNIDQGNITCYNSKAFNEAYEKARLLPDGPERQQYYTTMNRQLEADMPIILKVSRVRSWLIQPWVLGLKKHPVAHNDWMYIDIDLKKKK